MLVHVMLMLMLMLILIVDALSFKFYFKYQKGIFHIPQIKIIYLIWYRLISVEIKCRRRGRSRMITNNQTIREREREK
jgi:hypothetical protein